MNFVAIKNAVWKLLCPAVFPLRRVATVTLKVHSEGFLCVNTYGAETNIAFMNF